MMRHIEKNTYATLKKFHSNGQSEQENNDGNGLYPPEQNIQE